MPSDFFGDSRFLLALTVSSAPDIFWPFCFVFASFVLHPVAQSSLRRGRQHWPWRVLRSSERAAENSSRPTPRQMKTPDDAIASPSCDPAPWTYWSLAVEVMRRGRACFYEVAIPARLRSAFFGLLCILQSLPFCKNSSYCSVCGESQSKKMKHYAAKPIFCAFF